MADKKRSVFPISVSFSNGELPTASKLSGFGRQTKQGFNLLEHAIGDVWNQAGDGLLQDSDDAPNMIPNIARYIGATKKLNPYTPYLTGIQEYTHYFTGTTAVGQYCAKLPIRPTGTGTFSWDGTGPPDPAKQAPTWLDYADRLTNEYIYTWYLDSTTGTVWTRLPIQDDWSFTYTPYAYGDCGNDATFNVIPDPDTSTSYGFKSVKIQYVNALDDSDGYYIYLPPRGPLTNRIVNQSAQSHETNNPLNYGEPGVDNKRYFQLDTVAADDNLEAEHYRYVLPKLITDNWESGSILPTGMIYLWDPVYTKTIIEGLTFYAQSAVAPKKYLVVAKGSNLTTWLATTQGQTAYPTANLQNTSHVAAMYPDNGLRLITVGNSMSDAFTSLLKQFLNHKHGSDGTNLCTTQVRHNDLEIYDIYAEWQKEDAYSREPHARYLYRGGYNPTDDYLRNGMMGDLLMNSSNTSNYWENVRADSSSIFFGSTGTDKATGYAAGPELRYDFSSDALLIVASGLLMKDINDSSELATLKMTPGVSSTSAEIFADNSLIITADSVVEITSNDQYINIVSDYANDKKIFLSGETVKANEGPFEYEATQSIQCALTLWGSKYYTEEETIDGTTFLKVSDFAPGIYYYTDDPGTSYDSSCCSLYSKDDANNWVLYQITDYPQGLVISSLTFWALKMGAGANAVVTVSTLPTDSSVLRNSRVNLLTETAIPVPGGEPLPIIATTMSTGATGTPLDNRYDLLLVEFRLAQSTSNKDWYIYYLPFVRITGTWSSVNQWAVMP